MAYRLLWPSIITIFIFPLQEKSYMIIITQATWFIQILGKTTLISEKSARLRETSGMIIAVAKTGNMPVSIPLNSVTPSALKLSNSVQFISCVGS